MRYRLYNEEEPLSSAISQVLRNRGIPVEDQQRYLNASYNDIYSWQEFPQEDMIHAVEKLYSAIMGVKPIYILVDCDCDGYTSAAIVANYINKAYSEYVKKGLLTFGFHEGKQHGLEDMIDSIPPWTDLVICPDSSSGDFEQHERLINEHGVEAVVALDHHHCDLVSEYACVINNQMCGYPGKALTGAGVAWQFCRAFDETYKVGIFEEDPFYLLDLCALGNLADMADYRDFEIKAIVKNGLSHIKNPLVAKMVEKNSFGMEKMGGLTYMGFAFYVAPYINALCRSGTLEEKDLVFKAFLEYSDDKCVEDAVRILLSVKSRQTKAQNFAMSILEDKIVSQKLHENSVIVVSCDENDYIDPGITGLVANKIQSTYLKPTIVLNKAGDVLRGSGRNYSRSPIEDFRKVCEDTGLVEYAQGHAGSFGIEVSANSLGRFVYAVNDIYDTIDMTPTYWVDYVFKDGYLPAKVISDIAGAKSLWGQMLKEPLVALERISLTPDKIQLLSPDKHPTLKIKLQGTEVMKFKSSQEEYERFSKPNTTLTAVCTCSVNKWMGKSVPQLIIEDFELKEEWVF